MEFRPCIDIHNGKVKQIVGSSLRDEGDFAEENFVSERDAAFFADMYRRDGLTGGHIIMLNQKDSVNFVATREQAMAALSTYPGGMQIGGGITAENAAGFLDAGAAAVIVTSYVFRDGRVDYENLERLVHKVGREHVVLDLSCRYRECAEHPPGYYIVTDRWQKFTDERLCDELLDKLSGSCAEFLIHAVDSEGKSEGIETDVAKLLGEWGKIPVTYAGGIRSLSDVEEICVLGHGKLNVTVGSALDIFGGPLSYEELVAFVKDK